MNAIDPKTMLSNLSDERNAVLLYQGLAEAEKNPKLADIYQKMAEVEQSHVAHWTRQLEEAKITIPPFTPSWRTRAMRWIARRFGPETVLPNIMSMETQANSSYGKQMSQPDASFQQMTREEGEHARTLARIAGSSPRGLEGSSVAQLEGRHRATGGNALRAAVLGADDGLVSNLSLVMGVAGASLSNKSILITGMAGLLAGAISMALGEWLSVQSSRELYQHQINIETKEIETNPEEEARELALIYQARGFDAEQARLMSAKIFEDRAGAVETLAKEELSMDPKELGGSAYEAAIASFAFFAIGAIIPVSPFFFLHDLPAVIVSISISILALFGIGAAITFFTGKPVLRAGIRQVLFGLAAAAVTFTLGKLIGGSLGG